MLIHSVYLAFFRFKMQVLRAIWKVKGTCLMLANLLELVLILYGCIVIGVFVFQRKLMYHPSKLIELPAAYGVEKAEIIPLKTQDGLSIEAWYIAPENKAHPLIVYFHGNAGHIGDRMEKLNHFVQKGFGLLAVSYRGYGKSQGAPTEAGLFEDARTLLRYAAEALGFAPERLLLYGESLGTGVATYAAKTLKDADTPVFALVLEAPYTSVAKRSQELYPYLPAFYMVRDKYESIKRIAHVGCPVLIFHGEEDVVIPVHHGRTLLAAASEPKQGMFFPGVGHTDFPPEELAAALEALVTEKQQNGA